MPGRWHKPCAEPLSQVAFHLRSAGWGFMTWWQEHSKVIDLEGAGTLKACALSLYNVSSTPVDWSKQVTRPAQIQGVGIVTPEGWQWEHNSCVVPAVRRNCRELKDDNNNN